MASLLLNDRQHWERFRGEIQSLNQNFWIGRSYNRTVLLESKRDFHEEWSFIARHFLEGSSSRRAFTFRTHRIDFGEIFEGCFSQTFRVWILDTKFQNLNPFEKILNHKIENEREKETAIKLRSAFGRHFTHDRQVN